MCIEKCDCFIWHFILLIHSTEEDTNSKCGGEAEIEEQDDDGATKDSEARSSAADSKEGNIDLDRPESSGMSYKNICVIHYLQIIWLILGLDDDTESVLITPVTDDSTWPTMQDLNTRLRRVITSYQRNYKKEELKQQQKAKVSIFFHLLLSHYDMIY